MSRAARLRLGALAALLLLAACHPAAVPGKLYNPDGSPVSDDELAALRARRLTQVTERAAFDLRCAREEVRVVCFDEDPTGRCVTAGVDACRHRATYVWHRTDTGQSQWTLDASSGAK